MPDCDYCEESFGSQKALDSHLKSTHADELGPIDRRRLDLDSDDESVLAEFAGPLAIGAVVVLAAGVVGYVVLFPGGANAGDGPRNIGAQHYHGTIEVTITGTTIDFTEPRWKNPQEYPAFHFEGQNDPTWHAHADHVTLQYAMGTLGINVTDSSVTFDGTTYRDSSDRYDVVVQVNGEDVAPAEYVLKPDDHIRIVVTEQ